MLVKKKNLLEEFTIMLSKMEAVEFLGICKVLKVGIVKNNDTPREFKELLFEVISKFEQLNRKQKRDLMKLLRATIKGR